VENLNFTRHHGGKMYDASEVDLYIETLQTAYREMQEETGKEKEDIKRQKLELKHQYEEMERQCEDISKRREKVLEQERKLEESRNLSGADSRQHSCLFCYDDEYGISIPRGAMKYIDIFEEARKAADKYVADIEARMDRMADDMSCDIEARQDESRKRSLLIIRSAREEAERILKGANADAELIIQEANRKTAETGADITDTDKDSSQEDTDYGEDPGRNKFGVSGAAPVEDTERRQQGGGRQGDEGQGDGRQWDESS